MPKEKSNSETCLAIFSLVLENFTTFLPLAITVPSESKSPCKQAIINSLLFELRIISGISITLLL
ncbi:MAG: hypothetical protein Q7R70_04045 [Candidatus Diapherotrites archaeon]|nr:hypothetical protein [Candidatus Diapherotrites archaeon]